MPAERTSKFKPPRPSKDGKASKATTSRAARAGPSKESPPVDDEAAEDVASTDAAHTIPSKLLTKIMHEFFEDERTRMSKDADAVVGKYMETFVREALARAAFERRQESGAASDQFLEVEDLEKLAPQLLLDF
ncbi:MAG: hypothetical protein M1838_005851 [Thelocarpon superellum]|nr:MAG: hypothetical protein M1838_005851 [Thelocarpon superellum]